MLAQILYYGVAVEGLSPLAVFISDIKSSDKSKSSDGKDQGADVLELELFQAEETIK